MNGSDQEHEKEREFTLLRATLSDLRVGPLLDALWKNRNRRMPVEELMEIHWPPNSLHTKNDFYPYILQLKQFITKFNAKRPSMGSPPRFVITLPDGTPGEGYRLRIGPTEWAVVSETDKPRKDELGRPTGWKPFMWKIPGEEPESIPIQVWHPNNPKENLCPEFAIHSRWRAPKGFSKYNEHRLEVLKMLKARDAHVNDGEVWRVKGAMLRDSRTLEIAVQACRFVDYHATNLSLDKEIQMDGGRKTTIRGWLTPSWHGEWLQSFYPAAGTLSVNVLVETREGSVVLVQQGTNHSVCPGEWVASVSGTVKLREDTHHLRARDRRPDPVRTAYHEVNEELGVHIPVDRLKWVAFGFGLKMGTPALLAEIKVPLSEAEIKKAFDNRAREGQWESADVRFVPIEPRQILKLIHDQTRFAHRSFFNLALALALIRRGHAVRVG